jgi:hypothetical protein
VLHISKRPEPVQDCLLSLVYLARTIELQSVTPSYSKKHLEGQPWVRGRTQNTDNFHVVLCYSMLFLCMLIHVHHAYHLGPLIDRVMWRAEAGLISRWCWRMNQKIRWSDQVPGWEMLTKRVSSNNTDLLLSQASPGAFTFSLNLQILSPPMMH